MSNTHSTPSTPWLAASHLASGCYKTRKNSIFTGCNIHQKKKKDSNAVPVQAVQVSVVNNCKMWWTYFSYVTRKKHRHTEQNVASGNMLVSTSWMFLELLFLWFIHLQIISRNAHIKLVQNLRGNFFFSCVFFQEQEWGGGGVSATLSEIIK